MGSFGGFYKGEKRKKKKGEQKSAFTNAPTFSLPKIVSKKKEA